MNLTNLITAQIEGIEWVVVLIVIAILFLFGPKKIPELAHGFGRALGEFHHGRIEIEKEIEEQLKQAKDDVTIKLER